MDQQQAAVPDASIRIKDDAKGFSQIALSDREGRFVFPQLSPGTYTLAIEAKGFKRMERTNLELVANDKLALGNLTLEVGAVTDTVTVMAEATLVQSESAERSLAIQAETLRSIAVTGRGFTPLPSFVPGIISIPTTVRAMPSPISSPTGCAVARTICSWMEFRLWIRATTAHCSV